MYFPTLALSHLAGNERHVLEMAEPSAASDGEEEPSVEPEEDGGAQVERKETDLCVESILHAIHSK